MSNASFTGTSAKRPRLSLLWAAAVGLLLAFALFAAPAFAERSYDSQLTGLGKTGSITFDSADHLWIGHLEGPSIASEYDAYPSLTKITDQTGAGYFSGRLIESLAVNSVNGSLYVGDDVPGHINQFDTNGNFVSPQWAFGTFGLGGGVAIDNSGGEATGTVYAGHTGGVEGQPKGIAAFTPDHVPVNFSASQPYIVGNEIRLERDFESLTVDTLGNIYVGLYYAGAVEKFSPSGELVQVFGAPSAGIAVDPTNGDLLAVSKEAKTVYEFSPSGEYIGQITGTAPGVPFGSLTGAIAFNSDGYLYVADGNNRVIDIFTPKAVVPRIAYPAVSKTKSTSGRINAVVNPNGGGDVTTCNFEYGTDASFSLGSLPCLDQSDAEVGTAGSPITSTTEVHADLSGLTTDTTYYYRARAGNSTATRPGLIGRFTPRAVQGLHTGPATNVEATKATLNGSFEGLGEDTHYYFQYGTDKTYGESTPINDAGSGVGLQTVAPVTIEGLRPAATFHYRIVAINGLGTSYGQDETIKTLTQPSIESFFTSNLSASGAELHAKINPRGGDTHFHFEYGVTSAYGISTPDEDIGSGKEIVSVAAQITNLDPGTTYHFRVVAQNPYGTTISEDQAFNFHPADCPNAHLRQITNSSYLPDCRAYELVSPMDTAGTTLFPTGPNSPTATSPPRFAFGGFVGGIPGSGEPANALGDLYVATRTTEGWVTKYVGLPAYESLKSTGPPNDGVAAYILTAPASVHTNSSMDEFADWYGGYASEGYGFEFSGPFVPFDFTPHFWRADGTSLGETRTIGGYDLEHSGVFEQSGDFSHYVFQAGEPPSLSLIDWNRDSGTTDVVSVTQSGDPIPLEPGDGSPNSESLRVADTSNDGSHILMAARSDAGGCAPLLCPLAPSHLYMRVDDSVTYDISGEGHAASYVGMTPDGAKVYFTTAAQLTPEDEDSSVDLYMWSEANAASGEPLTLISGGDAGRGNTDECSALWTAKCNVAPFSNSAYSQYTAYGSLMGNGVSDNSIASQSGDIYFFSPEQLAGAGGANGEENLYVYRGGHLQYVTTLEPGSFCVHEERNNYCSDGPAVRMQVSSDGSHMAFLTASRIGSYNNANHTEMYTYDPTTGVVKCVSCLTSGESPTTNVAASSNGRFMADDGRAFFSTGDPLVAQDTDGLRDTYEFVEGHPQLISSGVTTLDRVGEIAIGIDHELFTAGLTGVSQDGTDVYFSTYDRLVDQDRNGRQLRFYDARSDGGFPFVDPPTPCQAADECHGEGSSPEAAFHNGSGAELGSGGNMAPQHRRRHRRHKRSVHVAKRHGKGHGSRSGRAHR